MKRPAALDALLAIKALALAPTLTGTERVIGCCLIEHFNRRTGQCDPSIQRLANLTGLGERTVQRSVDALSRSGLFVLVRNGGRLNRNRYEPVWSRFVELNKDWQARFSEAARVRRTGLARLGRQSCPSPSVGDVTQTGSYIRQEETGLAPLIADGLGPPSAQVLRSVRERAWNMALQDALISNASLYATVVAAITPDMQEAATDAEMQSEGAGLRFILEHLNLTLPLQDDDGASGAEP
jgi:hypothetical protein